MQDAQTRIALVVEDDRISGIVLEDWLRGQGWQVERVENGTEGLRRFQELKPRLVLADVLLPGIDGVRLCSQIRLQPFGERVWIGLLSARASLRDSSLAAGADFFLGKPLPFPQLAAELERLNTQAHSVALEKDLRDMIPGRAPSSLIGEDDAGPGEEGEIGPDTLVSLLRLLWEGTFTGVLEAVSTDTTGYRVRVVFDRGSPIVARSSDHRTGFASILQSLGITSPEVLEAAIEEARESGVPVGEVLVRRGLIDFRVVERAMREQIVARVIGIQDISRGKYTLQASDPMGLAGFEVHPAVIEWRLGLPGNIPAAYQDLHVALEPVPPWLWVMLDPDEVFRPLILMVRSGATVRTCQTVAPKAGSLIALLVRYKLARLTPHPPPVQRDPAPREEELVSLEEELAQRLRIAQDATHYTVLGLQPRADTEAAQAAALAGLARLSPEALPGNLSHEGRERARQLADRIREAGRVLSDANRRSIYDARMTGEKGLQLNELGVEKTAALQADRARVHFMRHEYVTAAALFRRALRLEGEDPEIMAMLGWARHRACPEEPSAGEPELRRALDLDPNSEFALYYLGKLLIDLGRRTEARAHLRQALRLNHEFEAAREVLKGIEGEG